MKNLNEKSEKNILKINAINTKLKKTRDGIIGYFYEEDTIKHITLVLYDLLPLSVKIGMRYKKFHEVVERNIVAIRNGILGHEVEKENEALIEPTMTNGNDENQEKAKKQEKVTKKPTEKKVSVKKPATKRVTAKKAVTKKEIKTTAIKKVTKNEN